MTVQIRAYEDKDYEMLANWWRDWNWQPVIKDWLPQTGAICSFNNVDIFAGFLIQTSITAAIIEWVVSNPAHKQNRELCKKELIEFLCGVAKEMGYSSVFVMTPSQHLIKTCQKIGFIGRDDLTSVVRFL